MSPVVLDCGPLVAIVNRNDQYHSWCVGQLNDIRGDIITCEAVVTETFFLIRHVPGAADQLLSLLDHEVVTLEFDLRRNLPAVIVLMRKYRDIPMSLADACLVRLSELNGDCRVFTLDSDFTFYRRHGRQAIPLITPVS